MSRPTPRFIPQIKLFNRPVPANGAFVFDAMASALRALGRVAPGRFSGVQWKYLRDDAQEFDGAPGMPRDFRPAVLLLDYSIRWKNTRVGGTTGQGGHSWLNESDGLPDYAAIIALEKQKLQDEIDELEAIETAQRSTEQAQQLADDYSILDELNASGYLRTGYNLLGTKVSGLFWGATLAPAQVRSGFTLEKDGSFTLGLQRWEAPRELFLHTYTIGFGRGITWYELVIGDDGNQSTFRHFRNMSETQRESLRSQLESVLDRGRLTIDDHKQLLTWEEEEKATRAAAKNRDRGERQFTDDESARIAQLQRQSDVLKDSKRGLTSADEELRRDLENRLYLAQEQFTLIEGVRSLLGKPLTLTFRFLKSGFVEIASDAGKSGKGSWLYENKRITGLVPPRYQSGLPHQCRIFLKSDGGKWALVFGNALHQFIGSSWSQPFTIPFSFDPEIVQFEWEADASFPGCRINAELVQLQAATVVASVPLPAQYQVRVDLISNDGVSEEEAGKGTPELYWLEMHLPAGAYPAWGMPVWDSENTANWENGLVRRVQDVTLRCEDVRSMCCDVLLADAGKTANLPDNIGALACDVVLLDGWDEDAAIPLITKAMVPTADMRRVKSLDGTNGFTAAPDVGHGRRLDAVGCENFLTSEIEARLSGHNKYPNDYLRQLALDGGLHPELILWDTGNIGIPKINKAKPGDYPSCKPAPGARYLEWMQDVVKNHCPGWALVSESLGLNLVRLTSNRAIFDRPALAYNNPPTVPLESPLCLRHEFHLRQDTRNYVTRVTAIGAVNPLTGMRYVATESLPQAHDSRFSDSMYFINREIAVTLPFDESLTSQAACIRRAREELFLRGRPPHFGDMTIDYDATLRPNQQPRVFGIKFIVTSVSFGGLNSGQSDRERMRVEVQLNEDRRPA